MVLINEESEGQPGPSDMDRWVAMAAPGVIIAHGGAGPPSEPPRAPGPGGGGPVKEAKCLPPNLI